MKTPIDLATWNRREHYNLFKQYEVPFWSVSANYQRRSSVQRAWTLLRHRLSLGLAQGGERDRCHENAH